jgi:protein phosphatase PTC7
MPHPLKAYRGGEDVRLEVKLGGNCLLGVFDGVGGWADLGVDPALYTRMLSDLISKEFLADSELYLRDEKPLVHYLHQVRVYVCVCMCARY